MNNLIEKLDSAIFSDDYIVFDDLDSNFATFFINDIDLNSVSLFNINLTDENFDYCDPAAINHLGLWIGMPNLNNGKRLKKEELMPVTWHPTKSWDWCLSEDEKKGIDPIFTDNVGKC